MKPKNGETTKKFDGKTYHWCSNHDAWTLHTPEECKMGDKGKSEGSKSKSEGENNVSFASSVTQIMDRLEEEE